jgi:hypothetical protein
MQSRRSIWHDLSEQDAKVASSDDNDEVWFARLSSFERTGRSDDGGSLKSVGGISLPPSEKRRFSARLASGLEGL